MEMNKYEAERCVEIAEMCISRGRREKAEKFLLKAEKMYSTPKAKELLQELKNGSRRTSPPQTERSVPRKRFTATKKEDTCASADYTKDQLEAVRRIKKCKDYYEILGVGKDATDGDMKKAYKKLALQLHPDKNKAPGAAEAFKAISNAVVVLTDVEKRRQYDLYGADERNQPSYSTRSRYDYTRGFEAKETAEEVFNMFCGELLPILPTLIVGMGIFALLDYFIGSSISDQPTSSDQPSSSNRSISSNRPSSSNQPSSSNRPSSSRNGCDSNRAKRSKVKGPSFQNKDS